MKTRIDIYTSPSGASWIDGTTSVKSTFLDALWSMLVFVYMCVFHWQSLWRHCNLAVIHCMLYAFVRLWPNYNHEFCHVAIPTLTGEAPLTCLLRVSSDSSNLEPNSQVYSHMETTRPCPPPIIHSCCIDTYELPQTVKVLFPQLTSSLCRAPDMSSGAGSHCENISLFGHRMTGT